MDRAGLRGGAGGLSGAGPARRLALLAMALVAALPLLLHTLIPGVGMPALAAAPAVFAITAALALRAMVAGYPHDRLGACNAVTLLRAAMTAGLAGLLLAPTIPFWTVVTAAVTALLLDGVDGWLARRAALVSDFGARFDMEVDALLALVLALLLMATGKVSAWVILLGGMRYAYVAAGAVWPWLQGDLPPRFGRKTVCVIQIATLIGCLAPPVTPPLTLWLAGGATGLLAWSFAADILWLWRRR
jgi:phosphatidylglycerophosphate synthase